MEKNLKEYDVLKIKKKPIHVVHIIDSAGYGGGERYILDIIQNASSAFHHWVAIPSDGPLKAELDAVSVPNIVINFEKRFSIKSILTFIRFIRQIHPAIIHSHGYRSNIYGRIAAILLRKSHVCTVHVSLYDYIDTPQRLRWMYMMIERVTSIASRRLICISSAMTTDMLRLGIKPDKIIQIPNGVDITRFHPRDNNVEIKRELGIGNSWPVIGTVGRMVTEKGQIYLIEALAKIKKAYPGLICLLFGEGPLVLKLKDAANHIGVSEICRFPGVQKDIEQIYPVMDLFVLPSLREPFGLVLLEAMASGIPVVASSSGGPLDFIYSGENGILVPPKNPDALAEKIIDLLCDTLKLNDIANEGYRSARENFNVNKTVKRIEEVYLSLIKV